MASASSSSSVWSNKWLFVLAAIGAAAGIGNLWRFPYMVYENGGAAFILAYLICLVILVIPLIIMEVAFGQTERDEFVTTLGKKAGTFGRFVGWLMLTVFFLVIGYFAVVVSWAVDFAYFSPTLAWGNDAQSFFYDKILQISSDPLDFGKFSLPIVGGLIITYLASYFSIFKGIKSIGKVIRWTVPLPFILLFILLINSLFLPGSGDGFRFLLSPDWARLGDITMWKSAVSQSFMSANIGLVMTFFYATFNKKETNMAQMGTLIALGNAAVSFLAAFAIFGTLGYMAQTQGVPISEVVTSGPTLAFVTFPNALSLLPAFGSVMAVLFFLSIFTLAIDTIFIVIEVPAYTLRRQFGFFRKMSAQCVAAVVCTIFFVWSLFYAGGNGLMRLDVVDHFLWGHLLFWAVIPEILIIGWLTPVEKLRTYINQYSGFQIGRWFNFIVRWLAPAFLIGLYVVSLPKELSENYGGYPDEMLWTWGYIPLILAVVISGVLALRRSH